MNDIMMGFVSAVESAALASYRWIGRGRKEEADASATKALREQLNAVSMNAVVVIGEGEMDEAPMLYIGERLGTGDGIYLDIAVDPLEGTNLIANGQENSTTVIAAAPRGSLLHAPDMYMEKIAVGPKAVGSIDIQAPLIVNLRNVARAVNKELSDMTVMVQQRERHQGIIEEIRSLGAKIVLFHDGDVTCAIAPAMETLGVDMFVGVGGAPEGVISAVAIKSLGGDMQARLLPGNEEERKRCILMGLENPEKALSINELVKSEECFFAATGITDGNFLKGVNHINESGRVMTHSILINGKSKTVRYIETLHNVNREKR
ncbi:class II fructose-bisphosphatase [Paenibacillus sp. MSJ-34]|uniref:class II fructose-bisphosphatase n=2 Tax=unclassified Paenibacillus TaxID=185978 RepID=UPI001C11BF78|nr:MULTISPECIES: class II fructose-bisphosphatase [unclassified Paenibacillus]MBU5444175.1 class II fructose-bisphosphatase [Paenibacillus sp. MSJ-34]CAH0122547.1 Fructose-1,6-bisphosphatase class 2 [Paenibacillus sp. CECT 9249]